MITASDLPGYSVATDLGPNFFPACADGNVLLGSRGANPHVAEGGNFEQDFPDGARWAVGSEAWYASSVGEAKTAYAVITTGSKFVKCVEDQAHSFAAGQGGTATVTAAALPSPRLGDQSAGIRFTAKFFLGGQQAIEEIKETIIRVDRALAALETGVSYLLPGAARQFPERERLKLANLMAQRMTALRKRKQLPQSDLRGRYKVTRTCNPGKCSGSSTDSMTISSINLASEQFAGFGYASSGGSDENWIVSGAKSGTVFSVKIRYITGDYSISAIGKLSTAGMSGTFTDSRGGAGTWTAIRTALRHRKGCADVAIYGVRGSSQDYAAGDLGMGPEISGVAERIRRQLPSDLSVLETGVPYPAEAPPWAILNDLLGNVSPYNRSVFKGTELLVNGGDIAGQHFEGIAPLALRCPDVSVVLAGLSQGAQVIETALAQAPSATWITRHIVGVLMYGNPIRTAEKPYNVGAENSHGILAAADLQPEKKAWQLPSHLWGEGRSYCLLHDPICVFTLSDFKGHLDVHSSYASSIYASEGAGFAVRNVLGEDGLQG